MITQDGWLDWAVRVPGPADKVSSGTNPVLGYVPHSAVGYYGGWASRLFSTDRRPDGRYTPYAAASVHGWIAYDGAVTQHYPLTAACWASGSSYPNGNFVAFENEGGFDPHDEPLTPAQISANVRIIRELAEWRGWSGFRRPADANDTSANLYEHCECVRWGSLPTACPSKRIPWDAILAELLVGGKPPKPEPVGRTASVIQADGTVTTMDIDEYAKGVLPYEMATGWPMEALKAQAVLAKSYALAAGQVYTDTRSQVYGPLRFPDTNAAVEAVKGVYTAKDGQVVMPFYFGHCSGRTRSPSEAGWSPVADRSFLQGVECPCGRTSYYGHGIGMCQRGAQALAESGKTFDQILRHYYQGIELLGFDDMPPPPPANAQIYTVKRRDTLSKIARKFGLEWEAIYLANRQLIEDPGRIKAGWQLVIPNSAMEEGLPEFYVVQPGDTLFSLSRKWGCSVDDIARLNALEDERMIGVGLRLEIPR